MTHSKFGLAIGALSLACFALVYAVQKAKILVLDGTQISKDVRTISGKEYVPVADIAKAFQLNVRKTLGGLVLSKAGGATQIGNSIVGKIGQEIFTGQWRFTVIGVAKVDEAIPEYLPQEAWTRRKAEPGMEIVVVKCRIKNGTTKKETIVMDKWVGNNTSLTSTSEDSFVPTQWGYDAKFSEHFPEGSSFLPGAAINFNLRFEVPIGTKLKDLVFTVIRYDDRSRKHGTDIRVHLDQLPLGHSERPRGRPLVPKQSELSFTCPNPFERPAASSGAERSALVE